LNKAREAIFERLEAARPPEGPAPIRVALPPMPANPEAVLRARVEDAGGQLAEASPSHWPAEIDWPIALEEIEHLYCTDAALGARGVGRGRPTPHELDPLEVCVLSAEFAVVENGAAWHVPLSRVERAAALLAQHLIVLVDAQSLVPTLHQAYQRIDLLDSAFGWFLCGPSKTADIEQSLVLGAHGPRTMRLVLLGR